jgi:hypothetical protein
MDDEPLYQDSKLKVDYLPNSEDHFLEIGKDTNKKRYIIQRGVLEDLARSPRGDLERVINTVNDWILSDINREGISVDGLHVAFCQAYMTERDREAKFYSDGMDADFPFECSS